MPVINYLKVDPTSRLVIYEEIHGLTLIDSLKIDKKLTYALIKRGGYYIAKLHQAGLIHGDLKINSHFIFDLKNKKITIIDLEKIKKVSSLIYFVKELNYISHKLSREIIATSHIKNVWNNFIIGYKKSTWPKAEKIIKQTKFPSKNILHRTILKTWHSFDNWLKIISRGKLKF